MMSHQFWGQHPHLAFITRTLGCVLLILALIYLYSYCGVANTHFIYNEF